MISRPIVILPSYRQRTKHCVRLADVSKRVISLDVKPDSQGRIAVVIAGLSRHTVGELRTLLTDAEITAEQPEGLTILGQLHLIFGIGLAVGGGGFDFSKELYAIVEAAGGFSGLAVVLRVFFTRNKFKSVRFGDDGKLAKAEGLSVDEIIALLDSLHSRRLGIAKVEDAESDEE